MRAWFGLMWAGVARAASDARCLLCLSLCSVRVATCAALLWDMYGVRVCERVLSGVRILRAGVSWGAGELVSQTFVGTGAVCLTLLLRAPCACALGLGGCGVLLSCGVLHLVRVCSSARV